MGSKREKYPEKCPWDLGPNQNLAKDNNIALLIIGHVTKDGALAGPKTLEH